MAEGAGVPPKTIRYYETIGLIRKADQQPNGYRAYSALDMRERNFIKRARSLGFSGRAAAPGARGCVRRPQYLALD